MFKFYITTRDLTQNYSHFNKNSFIEIHIIFSIFRIKMFHVKHFYFGIYPPPSVAGDRVKGKGAAHES